MKRFDEEKITNYLDSLLEKGIPSVDLIVYQNHKQIYRHMNGTVDASKKQSVRADQLYLMFSMTKVQTMTAVMQLVEQGKISLEDKVGDYLPAYKEADMIVFASPIYYFNMSAQMEAAIQRVYCIGKPLNAKKVALLLSSGSPGVYDAAIAQINSYCAFTGIDFVGSITANGAENKSEAKMTEIKEFAKAL